MKKRLLALLFALLLSVVLLASCESGVAEETVAPSADTTAAETQPAVDGVVLFSPGVCEYRIVYPSDETDAEFNAARKLQSLIEEKCGVKIEMIRSTQACGEKYDPTVKEIVLSYVDMEEFHVAVSELEAFNTYIIRALGNKIIVTGNEREGFVTAFEKFVEYIVNNDEDGKVVLSGDFFLSGKAGNKDAKAFYEVPAYPGGMVEDFALLGNNYTQATIYKTDAEMYEYYSHRLEAYGYTLYSENEISGNLYSTYTKEEEMVYYYYCPNTGETRIIVAEDVNLPSLEEVKYTAICEPAFISLKSLDDTGAVSGDSQGCIIRFADGTFLVYDGGNKNSYQAKQIYEALATYAPDSKNIVIRAWMFSHYHGDHTGAFQTFVSTYKNSPYLTIESFIYNFCNTAEQTQTFSNGQMVNTDSAVKTMGADIPVYKCLTGQIYRFPGMDMEVLATMSDFIPQIIGYEAADADLSKGDGNTMTVVTRLLTPEGNTCMLTGDATNIVLDCMVDRYGDAYLDSDIVTTPHHAHNRDSYRARNATIKFYNAVKPNILVVTSPNMKKFTPTSSYPYEVNVYVIKAFNPTIYKMDKISLISLSTLKEIK